MRELVAKVCGLRKLIVNSRHREELRTGFENKGSTRVTSNQNLISRQARLRFFRRMNLNLAVRACSKPRFVRKWPTFRDIPFKVPRMCHVGIRCIRP
ncbi:hypothetical protein K469DRAFT_175468 [Zopfia rhizophila CBS 207.26]|uniref:Uncharacterized protein n=1 Tax=Zopfia rhizophila CBS 207.26 TaxID=1314779 RepID=A0A6A6E2U3_9PEZI|nr:hypothetical protein K469DRAFT_175468 [Zopfia rhizophila CBS 207.26]